MRLAQAALLFLRELPRCTGVQSGAWTGNYRLLVTFATVAGGDTDLSFCNGRVCVPHGTAPLLGCVRAGRPSGWLAFMTHLPSGR